MPVRELIRWGIVVALGALSGYCFFGLIESIVDVVSSNRVVDSPQPFDGWFLLFIIPFTYLMMVSLGVAAARISYAVHRRDDRTAWQWGSLALGVAAFFGLASSGQLWPPVFRKIESWWQSYTGETFGVSFIFLILTVVWFYALFAIPRWIMFRLPNWICGSPLNRLRKDRRALENAANGGSKDDGVDLGIIDETASAVR